MNTDQPHSGNDRTSSSRVNDNPPGHEGKGIESSEFMLELLKVRKAVGLELGMIRLIEPDGKTIDYSSGIDGPIAISLWDRVVSGRSLAQWLNDNEPVLLDDRLTSEYLRNFPELPLSIAMKKLDLGEGSYALAITGNNSANIGLSTRRELLEVFAAHMVAIFRSEKDKRKLIHRNEELQTLYETSQAVASSLDRDDILGIIAKRAANMIGADVCLILEAQKKERLLQCLAVYSVKEHLDPRHLRLRFGEGLSGLVAETGEGMLIKRADLDNRSKLVDGTQDEPSSVISVPLKLDGELLGVMTLEKTPGLPFDEDEYHLVEMFSMQVVLAFKNSNMFQEMKGLLQSQQMYNVLLTHDVANYNVPIHGYLEMLIKDPKLDERERRYVRSSLMQSENISSLISDVRRLWWLRSGGEDNKFKPVNVVQIIREAIDAINGHILFGNVEIAFNHDSDEAWVGADMFLKDVFYNLLSNACKYGDRGTVAVNIKAIEDDGFRYWRTEVEDHGKGIPDDRKDSLFMRFDQFDSNTAAEGHGLGLSVVLAFISHYGGRTWVENRIEGDCTKGSRFVVLLPMIDKQS